MKKNNKLLTSDFIVCYTTPDGIRRFTHFTDPNYCKTGEIDTTAFNTYYPDAHIIAAFNANDNIFDKNLNEKSDFINNCRNYDFEPDDYHRLVSDNFGHPKYLFAGFLPRNTKYKALLFDKETGHYIKATLSFVERHIIFSPQEV